MAEKKIVIIGSGFSGLSAACFMAKAGWEVTVLEQHELPGGRARKFEASGFTFDMGPSWYWMPDVFDRFFERFGKKTSDYYNLKRLDPSYRVYWKHKAVDIPANYDQLQQLFERIEPGSAMKLDQFLKEAEYKYKVGMQNLVYKPGLSLLEFVESQVFSGMFRLDLLSSMRKHVNKYFKSRELRELMEFPVLFLGALPENTPALYSLMNYADIKGGTWFPEGGMYSIVQAMYDLATELGVDFKFNTKVNGLSVEKGHLKLVQTESGTIAADAVIAGADYHFVEDTLLGSEYRNYDEKYWNERTLAPSCLIYYVGVNKKLSNIKHHMLFFDAPFQQHAVEIYETKVWPSEPLFYVSATSVTEPALAPENCENLFFLVPVATGLNDDTEERREQYFTKIVLRFEEHIGESISDSIVYKRSFAHRDFISDYNSFKGNAYGLANTLLQTAILKPSIKNKKVKNLYYTGQLTVPGPGVPPSIISGEIVAKQVVKDFEKIASKSF